MASRLAELKRMAEGLLRLPDEPWGLDALLARADPKEPFPERLRWIRNVCRWVASPRRLRLEGGAEALPVEAASPRLPQATRLTFLLNVLERHPEWKARVARTLRATLREVDALELFCESGLPREPGLWTEAYERIAGRLLPSDPFTTDLAAVLLALFPTEDDAAWLERLPDDAAVRLRDLLRSEAGSDEEDWDPFTRDGPDALLVLVSDLRAVGLSTPIRRRLDRVPFRELPFFGLTDDAERTVAAWRAHDEAALGRAAASLMERLARCQATLLQVRAHLDEFGVSLKVVYLSERMDALIARAQSVLELLAANGGGSGRSLLFVARLVRDTLAQRRVRSLIGSNLSRLARKVVDRSAETGEHYITRTRDEYRSMLKAAAGGGALTAITTWVKLGVTALPLPPFLEGVLASLNYALSFVAIQLAHFTLATKQPAMTGPALAARMHEVQTKERLEGLVDEIVHLVRSQAAGIFGNVTAVVPAVLLTSGLLGFLLGSPPLGPDKAAAVLVAHSVLGPTAVYAAFTGVLLWLSSLFAGGADNWFALRGLRSGLAGSPRLRLLLGPGRAARFAHWLDDNLGGLAGNVSLGFLLGLSPKVAQFLGLPLDVRHVTLSAGQLAAATATLGPGVLAERAFWLALLGLAVIGLLNVLVSFGLALLLALRARGIAAPGRNALRRALVRRLRERPASFLAT